MTHFPGVKLSWRKKPVIWRFDVLTLWSVIFSLNVQRCHPFSWLITNTHTHTPNASLLRIPFFAASILGTMGPYEAFGQPISKNRPSTNFEVLILCNLSMKCSKRFFPFFCFGDFFAQPGKKQYQMSSPSWHYFLGIGIVLLIQWHGWHLAANPSTTLLGNNGCVGDSSLRAQHHGRSWCWNGFAKIQARSS